MWKCPSCGEEIDYVCYRQNMTEYGNANLPSRPLETISSIYGYIEHDCDSSDSNDDATYSCPECSDEIALSELVWIGSEPATIPAARNRDGSIRPAIMEETTHDIVHNSRGGRPSEAISTINIKCPECGHDNLKLGMETFMECEECHHMIDVSEAIQAMIITRNN